MTSPNAAVAAEIKAYRARKSLSQEELAEAASIPLRTYKRYESGERPISVATLTAVAGALGTTPRAILTDAEGHSPEAFEPRSTLDIDPTEETVGP